MQASEEKLTAQNLMKTIELRLRFTNNDRSRYWLDVSADDKAIEIEAHEALIPEHLVRMENDLFMYIIKKSNLKPIYDDCYHAVESFQFQTSK